MSNVVKANFKKRDALAITCTACGAAGVAGCDCGAPYTRARELAVKAVAADPHKSVREIANEIGVGRETVRRARKSSGDPNGSDDEMASGTERAKAAIAETPTQTNVAIGKRIGVSEATVRRARKAVPPSNKEVAKRSDIERRPQRISLLSDEPCTDCDTQQEHWHRSVSNMAGEAISLSAYWTQQFGKDWQKFEVTSEVLTLAKQAAEAWNEIVQSMINREKGNEVQISQHEAHALERVSI